MRLRLLLGPAGSGKTFRCLNEIRQSLASAPEGAPLLLVAPKQSTYELERQLLSQPVLPGYTRLQILSFERLAHFVFELLGRPEPQMLDEEGRLMVLRGLLARKRDQLKLFRASARLTGFAQQLSQVLRELQHKQLTPDALQGLAARLPAGALAGKLHDLAGLLQDYLRWLQQHQLHDVDSLLPAAILALGEKDGARPGEVSVQELWVDGFAELSPQEVDLLSAVFPLCRAGAVTFCLDSIPAKTSSWASPWTIVRKSFEFCRARWAQIPDVKLDIQCLAREPKQTRFVPLLQHVERAWAATEPANAVSPISDMVSNSELEQSVSLVLCASPEAEAVEAARELRRHVRQGGRWREAAVLVRNLAGYHQILQRVFSRYEIPFFLDRRESVSHHPLAELTRSALRTVAFQWQGEDWFAALKTGLVPVAEEELDRLENEALARGWRGETWKNALVVKGDAALTQWLGKLQPLLLPPFQRLALAVELCKGRPTGRQLARALRQLWTDLEVERQLESWVAGGLDTSRFRLPASAHATVWDQMHAWLDNLELGFPNEGLPVREWLPLLEAGLSNLTVGVIPPALDQVLIGPLERSRNPEIKLALVLGMNDSVFPARAPSQVLLTDSERLELQRWQVDLGSTARDHLAREQYYAYLALTRARQRLVLTCAQQDSEGTHLSPSPFLTQLRQILPGLELQSPAKQTWRNAEHASELMDSLLPRQHHNRPFPLARLDSIPALATALQGVAQFSNPEPNENLSPELALKLYGPVLRSSVSRLEQFAACPFKFFIHSGLRAEERQKFELDAREQGTFQHDVLALFHEQLHSEGKQWRDLSPTEARKRLGQVAAGLVASYRDGLLQATEQTRFLATVLTESLQDFIETVVTWMRQQYQFKPVAVELGFGYEASAPAWTLELQGGRRLELHGRIDRVDVYRLAGQSTALCVVVDYKSSQKQLDPVLLAHGLQLQLLGYLNVLLRWPDPRAVLGAERLVPAGVFYVNLRGQYEPEANRIAALSETERARKLAYRHSGRFDIQFLPFLDSRPNVTQGDQFNYRLRNDGRVYKACREAMPSDQFTALLSSVETRLTSMGNQIYTGCAPVEPYQRGATVACDQCTYQPICRIDPWTHRFRVLRAEKPAAADAESS